MLLLDLGVTSASTSSSQVQILADLCFQVFQERHPKKKICTKKSGFGSVHLKNFDVHFPFLGGQKGCVIVILRSGNEGTT